MKRNIFTALLLMGTSLLFSQNAIEKVLRKYKNDDGVISLNFAGDLSKFLKNECGDLKTKIESCEVLIFEGKSAVSSEDKTKLKSALASDKYETLMNVKDKKGKINIQAISNGESLKKVYAEVSAEGRQIYLVFTGKLYFEELSKLNLNFEGGDVFKGFLE
ncbi:MAG TPA: DUF4252 domain-containing protein [Saprospiraceae bacterium]|nr:DUF4252 domain-containing protein [Saprospiraceae bacterium]HRG21944.1 DUF4252 domain-containing protein [Saprospiraceae bacterium]HRG65931.1 DUF4252 domain-containing protein [Saprospiraceae bacterium]